MAEDKEVICYDEPTIGYDESGADINIPSFLLFEQDGDPVKHILKKDRAVRAEMSWKLTSHNTRVEYGRLQRILNVHLSRRVSEKLPSP